jgi:hypothetical protein
MAIQLLMMSKTIVNYFERYRVTGKIMHVDTHGITPVVFCFALDKRKRSHFDITRQAA